MRFSCRCLVGLRICWVWISCPVFLQIEWWQIYQNLLWVSHQRVDLPSWELNLFELGSKMTPSQCSNTSYVNHSEVEWCSFCLHRAGSTDARADTSSTWSWWAVRMMLLVPSSKKLAEKSTLWKRGRPVLECLSVERYFLSVKLVSLLSSSREMMESVFIMLSDRITALCFCNILKRFPEADELIVMMPSFGSSYEACS